MQEQEGREGLQCCYGITGKCREGIGNSGKAEGVCVCVNARVCGPIKRIDAYRPTATAQTDAKGLTEDRTGGGGGADAGRM